MRNQSAVQESNKHTKCKWDAEIARNLVKISSFENIGHLEIARKGEQSRKISGQKQTRARPS